MNKKVSKFFVVAIMALASFMPMFAQAVRAQDTVVDSPRKVVLINQFNRRAFLFSDVALRASNIVGNQRMLFLLSAQLGIPVTILHAEFSASGLGIDAFLLGTLLARSAGVPSVFVFDLINSGRNFGQVALQLNVPFRISFLRISGLMSTLIDEINIANGFVPPAAQSEVELNVAIANFQSRFNLFQNVLGAQALNTLLIRRLSFETGLDVQSLIDLQGQLPVDFSGDQFALFVLLDNTMSAAVRVALERNGVAIVTPGGIFGRLLESEIPVSLFLNRMIIFQRVITQDTEA